MKLFRTQIASVPDRENVVFEIWHGKFQVAEISHEPMQSLTVEIYPALDAKVWRFELREFIKLLNQGAEELAKTYK